MTWAQRDSRTGEWLLSLRVTPRAKQETLSVEGGQLRVRLKAPPTEGKANDALRRLLVKRLRVPKSAVSVEAGARGRDKTVRIAAEPSWPEDLVDPEGSGR